LNDKTKARCEELRAALVADLGEGPNWPLAQLAEVADSAKPESLTQGQVWSAIPDRAGQLPTLVALTHVSEVLRGVLASDFTFLAANDDVVVPPSESPTGREMILSAWSDTPVPKSALKHFVGEIGAETLDALLMVLQRELTGGFKLRATGVDTEGEEPRIKWSITSEDDPSDSNTFLSGARITEVGDPRNGVRQALLDGTVWLSQRALEELGEVDGTAEETDSQTPPAHHTWVPKTDHSTPQRLIAASAKAQKKDVPTSKTKPKPSKSRNMAAGKKRKDP
jgi:hypothetical protein